MTRANNLAHPVEVVGGVTAAGAVSAHLSLTDGSLVVAEATGLVPKVFDYIAYTATSATVDTYVYKTGGSGGSAVATVTVTWTDSTKTVLATVART